MAHGAGQRISGGQSARDGEDMMLALADQDTQALVGDWRIASRAARMVGQQALWRRRLPTLEAAARLKQLDRAR